MRALRTFLYAFAVLALAACGGGSAGNALPAASDPGTRAPSGSNVEFAKDTVWLGYDFQINAFSTNGNGAVTPVHSGSAIPWSDQRAQPTPGIIDLALAYEGTQWILERRDYTAGGPGWRLFAVAPGQNEPENVFGDDTTSAFGVGLAGDGIMVGYRETNAPTTTIATYPYAASNAPPIRTFRTTKKVVAFAEGYDGFLYVARSAGYEVFRPTSDGTSGLVRRVYTDAPLDPKDGQGSFAVGQDNSVYIVDLPGSYNNPVMYVNVYLPGSGHVSRRIGPIPADYGGFGFPRIAVDKLNRLYVATTGKIYRYGPKANGNATPGRVMTDSTQARVHAIAIGPAI